MKEEELSKCCGAEALKQVGGQYGCKKCENYCEIEKSKLRCEVCDLFECTCFCKCGLPHEQCVCDFKPEDYENPKDYPDICPFCSMPLSQMIKEIYQEEGLCAVIKQIIKKYF